MKNTKQQFRYLFVDVFLLTLFYNGNYYQTFTFHDQLLSALLVYSRKRAINRRLHIKHIEWKAELILT